jgi:hypothetical protein
MARREEHEHQGPDGLAEHGALPRAVARFSHFESGPRWVSFRSPHRARVGRVWSALTWIRRAAGLETGSLAETTPLSSHLTMRSSTRGLRVHSDAASAGARRARRPALAARSEARRLPRCRARGARCRTASLAQRAPVPSVRRHPLRARPHRRDAKRRPRRRDRLGRGGWPIALRVDFYRRPEAYFSAFDLLALTATISGTARSS